MIPPQGSLSSRNYGFHAADLRCSVRVSMYSEYKEPLYAAPPLLQRMVQAGRLGRKSGAGFYEY